MANSTSAKPKAKAGRPNAAEAQLCWCDTPAHEADIRRLVQAGQAAEARALLLAHAVQTSPVTQFFRGVCVGQLEGEDKACALYESCLQQSPLLHAARTNLIRGLLQRRTAEAASRACEHAQLAARLQPQSAEVAYMLGVVCCRPRCRPRGARLTAAQRRSGAAALSARLLSRVPLPPSRAPRYA